MNNTFRLRAAVGALLILGLAACGGGGSSPSALPTVAPTAGPTANPSASPTIAANGRAIAAAPTGIVTSSGALSVLNGRNFAQSEQRSPLSALVSNTIPTVVWSYSANPNWGSLYGQLVTWAYNTSTSATLPETNLTASDPSLLSVQGTSNNASFYGLTNDWLVTYNPPTGTGQTNTAITFTGPNAASGSVPVNVYDTFYLGCSGLNPTAPLGNVYRSGTPTPTANLGAGDVQIDCAGENLQAPLGGVLASPPVADTEGNVITTIADVTAAQGSVPSTLTSFPISSLRVGQVYVARTQDGGFAKFEILVATANGSTSTVSGISWHSTSSGAYSM